MNREISFRAWDNVDYMSKPFTLFDIQNGAIQFASDTVFMQATGLRDCNGIDIYEGDILCWPKYEGRKYQTRWVMTWNEERAAWNDYSPREEAKIIGNVYQNSDLLK